jgi:hypothetical protein
MFKAGPASAAFSTTRGAFVAEQPHRASLLNRRLGRRRALAAAVTSAFGAAVLVACGSDDDDSDDENPEAETRTMYASVRSYDAVPDPAEAGRQVQETFVPGVKEVPGFIAYFFIDTGGGTMVSITVCEDKAGTDESVTRAAQWVEDHPGVVPPATSVVEGTVVSNG